MRSYMNYERHQERVIRDEELIDRLDPYGKLEFTVGGEDEDGDWTAHLDACGYVDENDDLRIAAMVVVNSDSSGYIEIVQCEVHDGIEASMLIDLPMEYLARSADIVNLLGDDIRIAMDTNKRWNDRINAMLYCWHNGRHDDDLFEDFS